MPGPLSKWTKLDEGYSLSLSLRGCADKLLRVGPFAASISLLYGYTSVYDQPLSGEAQALSLVRLSTSPL